MTPRYHAQHRDFTFYTFLIDSTLLESALQRIRLGNATYGCCMNIPANMLSDAISLFHFHLNQRTLNLWLFFFLLLHLALWICRLLVFFQLFDTRIVPFLHFVVTRPPGRFRKQAPYFFPVLKLVSLSPKQVLLSIM